MSTGVYAKTAGDLIRDALRAATISGISLPIEPDDFAQGFTALNDILLNFQTKKVHIWSQTEALLPLNTGQQKYVFGVDHAFSDYVYTTALAASAGATTLNVLSTVGMTNGDFIGIELSDFTRQWTTLTIVDGDTVTLAAPLTLSVNNLASVYTYTTGIDQPIRIESMRYAANQTANEISTSNTARDTYFNQSVKDADGSTNMWYFSRQLDKGELYIWPVADNCMNILRFTFLKPQYIPEDQSENILIPPEWYIALKFKLAADLAVTYNVDANKQMMLEQKAAQYLQDAIQSDDDNASFQFYPSYR